MKDETISEAQGYVCVRMLALKRKTSNVKLL
jgi:hypothetical protein